MTECADCVALDNAPVDTSPHAQLLLHSEVNINFGATASGVEQYYVCNACGTQWERDVARSEPDAVWRHTSKLLK